MVAWSATISEPLSKLSAYLTFGRSWIFPLSIVKKIFWEPPLERRSVRTRDTFRSHCGRRRKRRPGRSIDNTKLRWASLYDVYRNTTDTEAYMQTPNGRVLSWLVIKVNQSGGSFSLLFSLTAATNRKRKIKRKKEKKKTCSIGNGWKIKKIKRNTTRKRKNGWSTRAGFVYKSHSNYFDVHLFLFSLSLPFLACVSLISSL